MEYPEDLSDEELFYKDCLDLDHFWRGHILITKEHQHEEVADIWYYLLIHLVVIHRYEVYTLIHISVELFLVFSAETLEQEHVVEVTGNVGCGYDWLAAEYPDDHLVEDYRQYIEDLFWSELSLVLNGLYRVFDRL